MTDSVEHPYVEWIAREARRPVVTDQAARARIMAAVRAEPLPKRHRPFWSRVAQPRVLSLSPVTGGLLAAGLVGVGVIAGAYTHNRDVQPGGEPTASVASQLPVSDTVVKLYFVAPGAARVSLVGDFNGWDDTRTPMAKTPKDGLWAVTLPLSAGRHQYAFIVDGKTWRPDPDAPVAPDDGYGHASSVMIVRRGSAL